MKKNIVIIDQVEKSNVILEKATRLSSDPLLLLITESFSAEAKPEVTRKITSLLNPAGKSKTDFQIDFVQEVDSTALSNTVIKHAQACAADLVMVQKPKYTDEAKKIEFAKKLLHSSIEAKLFFSRGKKWKSATDVMCALDIGETDDAHRDLDKLVYSAAKQAIASHKTAKLHLASVISISRISKELDIVEESVVLTKKGPDYRAQLAAFDHASSIDDGLIHVTAGLPSLKIPALVKQHNIDLLVMGNVHRKGLKGLVLGNTSEQIITNISSDVLVVSRASA